MNNYKSIFMIIISLLLIVSLFLNLRSCGGVKDDKYSKLENENLKLQKFRYSLLVENTNLKNTFQVMQDGIDKRHDSIISILSDLKKIEFDLKKQKDRISQLEQEKKDVERRINDLMKNPIKRDDDDLIKSLKNKLKP